MGIVGSFNLSMVGNCKWGMVGMVKCRGMVVNWGMGNNSGLFNMVGYSLDLLECWVGNSFGSNNGFLGQNGFVLNDGLRNMFGSNDFAGGNMGNRSGFMDHSGFGYWVANCGVTWAKAWASATA